MSRGIAAQRWLGGCGRVLRPVAARSTSHVAGLLAGSLLDDVTTGRRVLQELHAFVAHSCPSRKCRS